VAVGEVVSPALRGDGESSGESSAESSGETGDGGVICLLRSGS